MNNLLRLIRTFLKWSIELFSKSNRMENLLNFEKINDQILETPVYRYYSLDKFLISLNEKCIQLIKPKLWEDPFEGFILNQAFWSTEEKNRYYEFTDLYKEKFYGQCWTFKNESDFLWRIYAPNKDGIMVKSTIKKLYNYLQGMPRNDFYIGKVIYLTEKEIIGRYSNIDKSVDWDKLVIDSLLIKRIEFQEEKELRLIYFSKDSSIPSPSPLSLSFPFAFDTTANLLFEEIIIDPRINSLVYNSVEKIIRTLGYKGNIRKSRLYEKPIFPSVLQ